MQNVYFVVRTTPYGTPTIADPSIRNPGGSAPDINRNVSDERLPVTGNGIFTTTRS